MNVKELMKELRACPRNMEVYTAMHDNAQGEAAGEVSCVFVEEEVDVGTGKPTGREIVVIRG